MKIIVSKLNKEPYHALTKKDVKRIFKIVPEEWVSEINIEILSAENFAKSRFDRPVIYDGFLNRLKIISRGFSKARAAKEVFRELGVAGGVAQRSFAHHVHKSELKKLDKYITPYLEEFLRQIECQ